MDLNAQEHILEEKPSLLVIFEESSSRDTLFTLLGDNYSLHHGEIFNYTQGKEDFLELNGKISGIIVDVNQDAEKGNTALKCLFRAFPQVPIIYYSASEITPFYSRILEEENTPFIFIQKGYQQQAIFILIP